MGTAQPSVKQSYSCFPNTTVPKINMEMIRRNVSADTLTLHQ